MQTISEKNKSLQPGEKLRFHLRFDFPPTVSGENLGKVTKIKFNNIQICQEEVQTDKSVDNDRTCAKFEMNRDAAGSQWNASLTLYPQRKRNQIIVDIELNQPVLSFGVIINDIIFPDNRL